MTTVAFGLGTPVGTADVVFDLKKNISSGERQFRNYFGKPSSLEADLFRLAAATFSADRACVRGDRERYGRTIDLTVPVVNVGTLLPVAAQIERVLRRLSNDSWSLRLVQIEGEPSPRPAGVTPIGQTLLFSGGLDSFAAALLMQESAQRFQLVSHVTQSRAVRSAQDLLLAELRTRGSVEHFRYVVSSRDGDPLRVPHDGEPSQRTRSFVFLILAAITGLRAKCHDLVVIAENGPLAIHLPLTAARSGAYSTHTAHPKVLTMMSGLLTDVFGVEIRIRNPFVWKTKGEVVEIARARIPTAIPLSTSCWKASRLSAGVAHCGECVPCLIRRMAIEAGGSDTTAYARHLLECDIRSLGPDDMGRRNLVDLIEFTVAIKSRTDDEIRARWPELYPSTADSARIIDMYRRFAAEAFAVLIKYPGVAPLLA